MKATTPRRASFAVRFAITAVLFLIGFVCVLVLAGETDPDAGASDVRRLMIMKGASAIVLLVTLLAGRAAHAAGYLLEPQN